MRLGIFSGGSTYGYDPLRCGKNDYRHDIRYHHLLEEVELADELGFYSFGMPEQHFRAITCATASPNVLFGAIAARTQRIRLRSLITPLPFNHPVKVAEEAATIDVLSGGRYEIGTGRSNNRVDTESLGTTPAETRDRWTEGIQTVLAFFQAESYSRPDATYWPLPHEIRLVPKPVQKPHPPIFLAANSDESVDLAAAFGFGLLANPNYLGFEELESKIVRYTKAVKESIADGDANLLGAYRTNFTATHAIPSLCLEDGARARSEVQPYARIFTKLVYDLYSHLAKAGSKDPYIERVLELERSGRFEDMDYLVNESARLVVGDPDECIAQLQKFAEAGVDEVLLGIDGVPHWAVMESLELFGRYVIPAVRDLNDRISSPPGYSHSGATVGRRLTPA